jgi:hypothetical protein
MGYIDFTAGNVLTAAQMDTTMRQTVMPFADAATRDTALSGVLVEGMTTYQLDTNRTTTYDGTNWLITGGVMPALNMTGATDSIANGGGGTIVDFTTDETVVLDTDSIHSGNTGVVPTGLGGDWLITQGGVYDSNASGDRQLEIVVASNSTNGEGNLAVEQSIRAPGTLAARLTLSRVIRLEAGASVSLKGWQNSGGALNLTEPYLQMTMIRHVPTLT